MRINLISISSVGNILETFQDSERVLGRKYTQITLLGYNLKSKDLVFYCSNNFTLEW